VPLRPVTITLHPTTEALTVSLTMPAKPEFITLARLALTGLANSGSLPEETVADLKLALSEAVSNSVRHAYAEGGAGVVEVRYELRPEQIAIEVVDDGPGFDPEAFAEEEGELSEGGLGIAIIRALSDEFEVGGRRDGGGVRLRFVKRLSG
jgi:serine/threonine-protein kinase RsbW